MLEGLDSVRTGRPHPLQCECECVGVSGCGAMSSPFGTRLEPQHSSMMLLRCSVCVEGAVQRGNCFINFPPFPELATSWVLPELATSWVLPELATSWVLPELATSWVRPC